MDIFVARQPILDADLELYGYELLYRDGFINACNAASLDFASSKVIGDSFLVVGFDTLTKGKHVFLNVTEQVVSEDYLALLPKHAVIEILETVRPTDEVLSACRRLKEEGFRIALDDFVYDTSLEPLLDIADVVKLDWMLHEPSERARLVPWLLNRGVEVLAEKVETWEESSEACGLGCHYLQGFFFSKPEVVRCQDVPALEVVHFDLLRELSKPELSFEGIESLVKREVALTYKLLRYINSAAVGLRSEVESVRHAMVLLGPTEFKRWANLATIANLSAHKPRELLVQASARGRLAELLGSDVGLAERDQELFLLGMFSLLDAFFDRPIGELVGELGVTRDIRAALLEGTGPLSAVLACVVAIEQGDWEQTDASCTRLGIREDTLAARYVEAISWADISSDAASDERAA